MAGITIGCCVCTLKWKGILTVKLCYVVDKPGVGVMTPGALISYRLLVDIEVTGSAI
jgi:hypothetical protein